MRVSLNWLSDYVDVSLPAAELADLLLRIGFPVASIDETTSDIVLDVEVTSNRPDLLGHLGVARELSAVLGVPFKPPHIGRLPTQGKAADLTSVEVLDGDLCPRYTARVLRNVKVGPSPEWMKERLEACGLRSINNVVDVTNFVLLEYSQPLHSFDYDKLAEHRIVVRRAKDGESMVSIDRTPCRLDSRMLVIADAAKPVAVAGIMGGLDSEVSDATTNILLESAQFDPLNTRRTSRKLGILGESNYRFERGVDPVLLDEASLRACQLILETAGGELAEGVVDVCARPHEPAAISLRPERTDAVLGFHVEPQRQAEVLSRLHLRPRLEGDRIQCTAPTWRADLTREIDLIEEVARLEGYDKVPVGARVAHPVSPEAPALGMRKTAGEALRAGGFDEAVTISFIDAKEAELFGVPQPIRVDELVRRTQNAIRPTLLPSLLRAAKVNQDASGLDGLGLFEMSQVFVPAPGAALPNEHLELGLVSAADLRSVRGVIETVCERVAPAAKLEIRAADPSGLAAGAAAEILLDGRPAGVLGSVAPQVLSHYGIEKPLAAATLNLSLIEPRAGAVRRFRGLPRFPAIQRDLSFIVEEGRTWAALSAAIEAVAQPLRAAVEYVTTYRGKPIADGRKSVTVRLTYRSDEGTLRAEQVDEQVAQVVSALRGTLSAELRS